MSRPDYPKPYTPLTPGMISRIRSDQEVYDRDPERWERRERERKEEQEREQQAIYEEERRQYQHD